MTQCVHMMVFFEISCLVLGKTSGLVLRVRETRTLPVRNPYFNRTNPYILGNTQGLRLDPNFSKPVLYPYRTRTLPVQTRTICMGLTTPKSMMFCSFFWQTLIPTILFCRNKCYIQNHCLGHSRICAKAKLNLFDLGSGNSPLSIDMHGTNRRAHKIENEVVSGILCKDCRDPIWHVVWIIFWHHCDLFHLCLVWFHVRHRNISFSTLWRSTLSTLGL